MRLAFLSLAAAIAITGCNSTECAPACQRIAKECSRGSGYEQDCELQCRQLAEGPCISEYGDYMTCVATASDEIDCTALQPTSCAAKFDTYSKCLSNAQ